MVSKSHVSELRKSSDGSMTMVFDGTGREKGRELFARTLLTLDKGVLRLTEMTRQTGEPFLMRHSYELIRH
jgi:hypothetical protein